MNRQSSTTKHELLLNAPVSHSSDEYDDGVRVWDGGEVLRQSDGGSIEGKGCREESISPPFVNLKSTATY